MGVEFTDDPVASNIIELRSISQSYDGGNTKIIENLDLLIEDKPMQGRFFNNILLYHG